MIADSPDFPERRNGFGHKARDLGPAAWYKESMSSALFCSYASVCSGCDWLLMPAEEQRSRKLATLDAAWKRALPEGPALPDPNWVSIDKGGLRDRADLMIDRRTGTPRLGLFDRFQTGIVDLQGCPQMSPALESWLIDFRKIKIPVQRGSVRLRVSPAGKRGVWLDLANVDVKSLLDDRTVLDELREMAIVEIGQKRKRLAEKDGKLKLVDPCLEPWFETYVESPEGRETPVALHCAIGSFTQPGFRANRALVAEVRSVVRKTGARNAIEFGSGIGNFTFPLASVCNAVEVYEVDALALEGLNLSAGRLGWQPKITINAGNFQVERKTPVDFSRTDLVFVDPPRSGLMKFLDPLAELAADERPRHFVYVSCFAESFAADSARLLSFGYALSSISVVDQFPQSRHFEIVAAFERREP
jgi:23S rRNA (uracil1939-C5)-methyltransferase